MKLEVALKKLDHFTAQLDALHLKTEVIVGALGSVHQVLETQSARADEMINAIGAARHTLDSRLHQIDIKIRGPLDYDDTTRAVRTVDGYVLVPKTARELYILLADAPAEGLEPGTHRCLKALVDPGMTIADVGANVGMLTLSFARSVGAQGKVYAFEAEPEFQDLLEKSFALNGVPWVELQRRAAGRKAGTATFHVSPIAGHSSLYDLPADEAPASKQITVEVVTLDEALAEVPRVDLVKIDVEGAELEVLAGMQGLIARNPALAIVAEFGPSHLVRVGYTPQQWFDAFEGHGFRGFAIDEATGSCRWVRARDVENVVSVNIVFARPGTQIANRLERMGPHS
ncbi:FkbM family methyltransferase [Rhodopseudomonas palustris]|uniref:FkbM family methyltransferase n=1 Tax=Rhodopseudomonas palustris TaxID=1076 RepID=UPI00131E11D1|nr:FkbM family methyltransferase [Rhodopseudomonas palustris]